MSDEDVFFNVEEVETVIKGALVNIFADVAFDPERVSAWTNAVLEQVLKGLQAMGKNYKYIISAIILQKNGAGLHTAAGVYWDSKKDGALSGGLCGRRRIARNRSSVAAPTASSHTRTHKSRARSNSPPISPPPSMQGSVKCRGRTRRSK